MNGEMMGGGVGGERGVKTEVGPPPIKTLTSTRSRVKVTALVIPLAGMRAQVKDPIYSFPFPTASITFSKSFTWRKELLSFKSQNNTHIHNNQTYTLNWSLFLIPLQELSLQGT